VSIANEGTGVLISSFRGCMGKFLGEPHPEWNRTKIGEIQQRISLNVKIIRLFWAYLMQTLRTCFASVNPFNAF